MDSHIGLPRLVSLSAHGFILKPWVTVIGRCEGQDDMGGYLCPYTELETLKVYVYIHDGLINKEIDFHTTKNSTSLSALDSILKDFWELMSIDMRVILLVEDDKTLYILCRVGNSWGSQVQDSYKHVNEEKDSHTTKIRRAFRRSIAF